MAMPKVESSVSLRSFLAMRCAIGENARSSSTRASVAFSSSASGTHMVAMPQSYACWPGTRRERMTTSLVRVMPTIFCRRAEPPEPGIWPSFCSGSAYCDVSETMRKSHASEISKPTPKQKPRLAAITGLLQRAGAAMFHASFDTCSGVASRKPRMSPPLEKCSPIERSTITRTAGFSSSDSNTRRSWSRWPMEMMLKGGRSSTMSARSRAASMMTEKPSSFSSRVCAGWESGDMLVSFFWGGENLDCDGFLQAAAVAARSGVAGQDHLAAFERVKAVSDIERALDILLDQQDRHAVIAQAGDDGEDFVNDDRR